LYFLIVNFFSGTNNARGRGLLYGNNRFKDFYKMGYGLWVMGYGLWVMGYGGLPQAVPQGAGRWVMEGCRVNNSHNSPTIKKRSSLAVSKRKSRRKKIKVRRFEKKVVFLPIQKRYCRWPRKLRMNRR
jgi:hypothetical protein